MDLVERIAGERDDLVVYNLRPVVHLGEGVRGWQRAGQAAVACVPTVLVDGKAVEACQGGLVTEAGLRAGGIGAPTATPLSPRRAMKRLCDVWAGAGHKGEDEGRG